MKRFILFFMMVLGFNILGAQKYTAFVESGAIISKDSVENIFSSDVTAVNFVDFSVHTVHGFSFSRNKNFFIGVGVGFDQYSTLSATPYYLSVRSALLNEGFAFPLESDFNMNIYLNADLGKAWVQSNDQLITDEFLNGGLYLNSGIGLLFSFVKHVGISINASYKIQQITTENVNIDFQQQYRSYNIKFGTIVRLN